MVKKDIKEEANAYIKKSKEISNQAKEIIDIEKTEERRKQKEQWLDEAKELLKESKEDNKKATESLRKSKEFVSSDKDEAKKYAKEAKENSKKALKKLKKVIKLKNRIEENTKKWIKANLTLKNIALTILFFYTLAVIIILQFCAKNFINYFFDISYKYVGRFEFAQFASIGFLMIMVSVLVGFVIWAIHFFNRRKVHWWFWVTIILMFLVGTTGFMFVHMTIGQDDLELKLRDSSMVSVGTIKCTGSNDVLFVYDNVSCKLDPALKNISANVSFMINGTFREPIDFNNLNFTSPKEVEYISFEIEGFNEQGLVTLSTRNPYHFYTKEEYIELKARFVKYLSAILALIFITIPLIMSQLRKLHD